MSGIVRNVDMITFCFVSIPVTDQKSIEPSSEFEKKFKRFLFKNVRKLEKLQLIFFQFWPS